MLGNKTEYYDNISDAKQQFRHLYHDKTGNLWENRNSFQKVPNKFYPVDVDYGDDESLLNENNSSAVGTSKLDKRIQDVMKIFFDIKQMQNLLLELEIDLEKMVKTKTK